VNVAQLETHHATLKSRLDFESQLVKAMDGLENPEQNFALIQFRDLEFPIVEWGRDFVVGMPLRAEDPSSIKQFMRRLPKRFDGQRVFWGTYIFLLNQAFCRSHGVTCAQLRFSQISNDQCSLFHADYVRVRLFQTLRGLGTEFLPEDNVNRSGLGGGCNNKVVRDPGRIRRANEKEVLLMRGEQWFRGKGLVHRSPPIKQIGEKRLYLCLDPLTDH
jgi:hypothetical protein